MVYQPLGESPFWNLSTSFCAKELSGLNEWEWVCQESVQYSVGKSTNFHSIVLTNFSLFIFSLLWQI